MEKDIRHIESQMKEEWEKLFISPSEVSDDSIQRIKQRLDSDIYHIQKRRKVFLRISASAACLALMFLGFSTTILYRDKKIISSNTIAVNTGTGETASITLPDGSKAQMNYESQITYFPGEFGIGTRTISMSGEVFFDIAENEKIPFIINTENIRLKVLGTRFNMYARSIDNTVRIALEEGAVSICALKSGEEAKITSGEEIHIDAYGKITIIKPEHMVTGGWKERRLAFRDIPVGDVIEEVSKTYGIDFITDESIDLSEPFTGTLAPNNLPGVLDVLDIVFGFKSTMYQDEVKLTQKSNK